METNGGPSPGPASSIPPPLPAHPQRVHRAPLGYLALMSPKPRNRGPTRQIETKAQKGQFFVQGHTAGLYQRWDSDPGHSGSTQAHACLP